MAAYNNRMKFFIRNTSRSTPVDGIYAHHKAEYLCDANQPETGFCPPDLVSIDGKLPVLSDGEHECTIHGVPAILFYWKLKKLNRGLIVLVDDQESIDFARAKLEKKSIVL